MFRTRARLDRWAALAIGALAVAAFAAMLQSWRWRLPPGLAFTGYRQGDMPGYISIAEAAARSPTIVSYPNPHDLRTPAPPIFVQLNISFLGWLLRAGLPPLAAVEAIRIGFGAAMYFLLAILVRRLVGGGFWFRAGFLAIGFGGGLAWLYAALLAPISSRPYLECFGLAGEEYHGWWLDVFRNISYPFEMIQHVLLFAQLAALAARRWARANVLFLLGAAANPYLGVQMAGLQLGTMALGFRSARLAIVPAVAIAAAFAAYYGLFLPADPVAASLLHQNSVFARESLSPGGLLLGHGLALGGLAALLLDAPFRRRLLSKWRSIPVVVLVAWLLLLVENGRIQPKHFPRGYLFLGLWILLLAWWRFRKRSRAALIVLCLLSLPDSALFVAEQWRFVPQGFVPHVGVLPETYAEVVDFFRREPRPRRVVATDGLLSTYIAALGPHFTLLGHIFYTPDREERWRAVSAFLEDPTRPEVFPGAAIDTLVLRAGQTDALARLRATGAWTPVFTNSGCVVLYANGSRTR